MSRWKDTDDFFDLLDGVKKKRDREQLQGHDERTDGERDTAAIPKQRRSTHMFPKSNVYNEATDRRMPKWRDTGENNDGASIGNERNTGVIPKQRRDKHVSSKISFHDQSSDQIKEETNLPHYLKRTVQRISNVKSGNENNDRNENKYKTTQHDIIYRFKVAQNEESDIELKKKNESENTDMQYLPTNNAVYANDVEQNVIKFHCQKIGGGKEVTRNQLQGGSSYRTFGYKRLLELSDQKVDDIIVIVTNPKSHFQTLFQMELKPDFIILVMKVLSKVCNSEFTQLKSSILSSASNPLFLEQVQNYIGKLPTEENKKRKEQIILFVEDVLTFLETLIDLLPTTAYERLKKVTIAISICIKNIEQYQNISFRQPIFDVLENVNTKFLILETEKKEQNMHEKNDRCQFSKPPDDFRNISVIPTSEDIFTLSRDVYLRKNIVKGYYANIDHYLDVQFRLLREDFVGPLREGIQEYVKNLNGQHKINNIRIYSNVRFTQVIRNKNKCDYEILFDSNEKFKRIKWEYSKRFMYGSLLLFSKDNFRTFFLATVSDRNIVKLNNGLILVEITQETKLSINLFKEEYVMVESEVYFEPYFHVLSALQDIQPETFPMEKYIVRGISDNCLPEYFRQANCNCIVFDYKVDVLNENSWPSSSDVKLDPSQYTAFKSALTNEFVAIQGPPGTGKTHIGLMIAQVLLQNFKRIQNFGPLLVICYTNHALDQFLEGLLPCTDSIIRIGGQSRSEVLQQFNLNEVRKCTPKNVLADITRTCRSVHYEIVDILDDVSRKEHLLMEVMKFNGILSVDIVKRYMTPTQKDTLFESNVFEYWLTGEDYVVEMTADTTPNFNMNLNSSQTFIESESVAGMNLDFPQTFIESESVAGTSSVTEGEPFINLDDEFDEESEEDDEHYQRLGNLVIGIDDIDVNPVNKGSRDGSELYIADLENLKNKLFCQKEKLETLIKKISTPHDYVEVDPILIQTEYVRYRELSSYYQYLNMRLEKIRKININKLRCIKNGDVWQLDYTERWNLYRWWVEKHIIFLKGKIQELEIRSRELRLHYQELKQMEDLSFVMKADVVGITTTGAARIRSMLNKLKAKAVIVEEAAEVLEAHIVTSITKDCQHVILIGDHEQLRPSTAVYKLAKHYNMDISLFERMLKNGLGCYKLGVQHRMRPEIASLIVPTIYKQLENHPSVENRPNIKGITHNLFFVTHTQFEDEVPDSASRRNKHEADFMIALCNHLLLQGYSPNEITILTTYSGQMQYISKERKKNPLLKEVRITVVDKFQGEENRIILLSLVRSNKLGKIGFLSIKNRVCVALSRAKEGLYIIGNMSNLEDSSIWYDIKSELEKGNHLGPDLTLRCEVHQNVLTRVRKASDFLKLVNGGCDAICDEELECGHKCSSICHITDQEHKLYKCNSPCNREICVIEGHDCPNKCFQACDECKIPVKKNLPCGHSAVLQCYKNPEEENCHVMMDAVLPACGHKITKPCYTDLYEYHCSHDCDDRLPCGHKCILKCHKLNDPDHLEYKCKKLCTRNDMICTSNHKCKKLCYEECGKCTTEMKKQLACGHFHDVKCSDDLTKIICLKNCNKKLQCGHSCKRMCFEECGGCKEKVSKILPECKHAQKTICSEEPDPKRCSHPCNKMLKCKHPCKRKCNQVCGDKKCLEIINTDILSPCGHLLTNYECYLTDEPAELRLFCKRLCSQVLPCGHKCKGDCSTCVVILRKTVHAPCREKCGKRLVCGHICNALCREICPPCNQTCLNACEHRSCTKRCGERCYPCNKKCTRSCPHYTCTKKCSEICNIEQCDESCTKLLPCGHDCFGLCGEECPNCQICSSDNHHNTRFLRLEDCNCEIDVIKADSLFYNNVLGERITRDQINVKYCSECQKPIVKTKRYKQVILQTFEDIGYIKRKMIFQMEEISKSSKNLFRDIQESLFSNCINSPELFNDFVTQLKNSLSNSTFLPRQPTKHYALMIVAESFYNVLKSDERQMLRSLVRIFEQRLEYINKYDINLLNHFFLRLKINSTSVRSVRNTTLADEVWKRCKDCKNVSSWAYECDNCERKLEQATVNQRRIIGKRWLHNRSDRGRNRNNGRYIGRPFLN